MPEKILRKKNVEDKTGLSATTIWRLEKNGLFPSRRSLGNNSVGWLESEVNHWIEKLKIVTPTSNFTSHAK
jgi:prophage regulatory protein